MKGKLAGVVAPTIQTRLMDVARDSQSIAAALNRRSIRFVPGMRNALYTLFWGEQQAAAAFVATACIFLSTAAGIWQCLVQNSKRLI